MLTAENMVSKKSPSSLKKLDLQYVKLYKIKKITNPNIYLYDMLIKVMVVLLFLKKLSSQKHFFLIVWKSDFFVVLAKTRKKKQNRGTVCNETDFG